MTLIKSLVNQTPTPAYVVKLKEVYEQEVLCMRSEVSAVHMDSAQKDLALCKHLLTELEANPRPACLILAEFHPDEFSDESLKELLEYWTEQFSQAIRHELKPLSLLALLEEQAYTPILFAALVHSLLNRGLSVESLLYSGLFHRYFKMQGNNPDELSSFYSLLTKSKSYFNEVQLTLLLKRMDTIAAPKVRGVNPMTLSGGLMIEDYPEIIILSQRCSATPTKENWSQLSASYGIAFWIRFLSQSSSPEFDSWCSETINAMPLGELRALYKSVLTITTKEQRPKILKKLAHALSLPQTRSLIENDSGLLWVLLFSKPELLSKFDQNAMEQLIQQAPVTLAEAPYIIHCLEHPLLRVHGPRIYSALLYLWMKQPATEFDADTMRLLKNNQFVTEECKRLAHELLSAFKEDVAANCSPESLINVYKSREKKSPQWHLLERLSSSPLYFPHDRHDAEGFIMKALFEKGEQNFSCLDLFHPEKLYEQHEENKDTERHKAKKRSLLTCLAGQDDPELQEAIISLLASEYDEPEWRNCSIDNTPLLYKAIESENTAFLEHYYSGIFICFLDQPDANGITALHLATQYPKSLKTILDMWLESRMGSLLTALQWKDTDGTPVLHSAAHIPESLKEIFLLLPKEQHVEAAKIVNNSGESLLLDASTNSLSLKTIFSFLSDEGQCLDVIKACPKLLIEVLDDPALLQFILSRYPEDERLEIVKKQDDYGYNLLQRTANKPAALKIILSSLPIKHHLTAIEAEWAVQETEYSTSLLLEAAQNHESLDIIFSFLPDKTTCARLLKVKGKGSTTPLHEAVRNPDALRMMLACFPSDVERREAIETLDDNGLNVLQKAAFYPQSAEIILSLYPAQDRLDRLALVTETSEFVIASPLERALENAESFETMLSLLPKTDGVKALKIKDIYRKPLMARIVNNPGLLVNLLSPYSSEQCLEILSQQAIYDSSKPVLLDSPESLKTLLLLMSEEHRDVLVKDQFANLVARLIDKPKSLIVILSLLSKKICFEIIANQVLYSVADNPPLLQEVLLLLSEPDQLAAVKKRKHSSSSVLKKAIDFPDSLRTILLLYPKKERLEELQETQYSGSGNLLLSLAFKPLSLEVVFSLLPEEDIPVAIKQGFLLRRSSHEPESLKVILAQIPKEKRLSWLNEDFQHAGSVLQCATSHFNSLVTILSYLPIQHQLTALSSGAKGDIENLSIDSMKYLYGFLLKQNACDVINNESELNFLIKMVKVAFRKESTPNLLLLANRFLSPNSEQASYIAINPESFLRAYFHLQWQLKVETDAEKLMGLHWALKMITGEVPYDNNLYLRYQGVINSSPELNTFIEQWLKYKSERKQEIVSRLYNFFASQQLGNGGSENVSKDEGNHKLEGLKVGWC